MSATDVGHGRRPRTLTTEVTENTEHIFQNAFCIKKKFSVRSVPSVVDVRDQANGLSIEGLGCEKYVAPLSVTYKQSSSLMPNSP